jgi:Tol biopolymer transport system component
MRGHEVATRRRWLPAALPALLLAACQGDRDPAGPGGGPDPGPGDGPYLSETILLSPDTGFINDEAPDWSPDGRWIVFSGGAPSGVWKATTVPGDPPILVTDPDVIVWSEAAYTPGCLADGRICWYRGMIDQDNSMHVMAADTGQVAGEPPPTVLWTFRGPDVGLAGNQASSPHLLSVSGDGARAVGRWRSVFALAWEGAGKQRRLESRHLEMLDGAPSLRLSRDGTRIAFEDPEGLIAWMDFYGDTAHVVGEGRYPSWRGDDAAIGFVTADGRSYAVHDLASGGTVVYRASGAELRHAVLSWDGGRIAFLNGDGGFTTLGCGVLNGAGSRPSGGD